MILVNSKWFFDLLIRLSNYRVGNFKSKVLLQQSLIFQKKGIKNTSKKCIGISTYLALGVFEVLHIRIYKMYTHGCSWSFDIKCRNSNKFLTLICVWTFTYVSKLFEKAILKIFGGMYIVHALLWPVSL